MISTKCGQVIREGIWNVEGGGRRQIAHEIIFVVCFLERIYIPSVY